jgi:hypothetical protein
VRERSPLLPPPVGPVSAAVIDALRDSPGRIRTPSLDDVDGFGDDLQLALWCCYELHYLSFLGVDDGWEWEPRLLEFSRALERVFTTRLIDEIGPPRAVPAREVAPALLEIAAGDGPSLSGYMLDHGDRDQLREFLVHRSLYQRKEADPHTWAIPRVRGRVKAAMVEIQYDEYGDGVAADMHAELFATTMRALGLDPAYGAYLDLVPGTTLATDNLVTMFGLHRSWRAACVGHLALFEMTSVGPMGRYSSALRKLGVGPEGRRFYDVHVTADAVHQHIALDDMVGDLIDQDPSAAGGVLFGARALGAIEGRFAEHLLRAWQAGASSLTAPLLPERLAS